MFFCHSLYPLLKKGDICLYFQMCKIFERGQRTIFGNMDVKSLKEDYARCEIGDGYFYDVEADNLLKLKFIKYC